MIAHSGAFTSTVKNVPNGHLSLYELNIDRNATYAPLVYPFITKEGGGNAFGTITTTTYNTSYAYGDQITSSYPMSSSIIREHFAASATRSRITALKNTLNHYTPLSDHYNFSSSLGDKATQELGLISIPSIFYGSSIKKGTVSLKFYITGTLIGELSDVKKNGELVQISGSAYAQAQGSGSVGGVVLYNEGFVMLTGSWPIEQETRDYTNGANIVGAWKHFGVGALDGVNVRADTTLSSASFDLSFEGTNYVSTVTMFAHAPKGELNHSNNPTYTKYSQTVQDAKTPFSSSYYFAERQEIEIKNTVSSSYADPTASFAKHTYISKIGIYDDDHNLIGIASLATPVKKTEDRDLTFKLKYDI